jgi:hypothetical protein
MILSNTKEKLFGVFKIYFSHLHMYFTRIHTHNNNANKVTKNSIAIFRVLKTNNLAGFEPTFRTKQGDAIAWAS